MNMLHVLTLQDIILIMCVIFKSNPVSNYMLFVFIRTVSRLITTYENKTIQMECPKENLVCCAGNIHLAGKCIRTFCYVHVTCFKYIAFKSTCRTIYFCYLNKINTL